MEDGKYRRRMDLIYQEYGNAVLEASKKRDLAIRALTMEFNKTIGKK